MQYRHQEWKDGFINFDNNLFLSLDLCWNLRNAIEEHTAIGRVVGIIEKQYDINLPKQQIIKAFFLFDALSDHNFDFECLFCGYYPIILTFDCTRKACFQESDWQCDGDSSDDDSSDDPDDDMVDPVEFWHKVMLKSIAKRTPLS